MNLRLLSSLTLIAASAACGSSVTDTGPSSGSTGTGGATSTSTSTSSSVGAGATSTSSTTTTSSTSTSTSTGAGGGNHGACKSSADCGGKPCIALTPGGYTVCSNAPEEAIMCSQQMPPDQCCNSSDCMKGACFASTDLPACGGAQIQSNLCIDDACTTDADCNSGGNTGICAPAGAFSQPKRVCITAYCKTDADCNAMSGGACLPILNPCCSKPSPNALACVYPGGCAQESDCGPNQSQSCVIQNGDGVCKMGSSDCPG